MHRHADPVHACPQREDPTSGGRRWGVIDVVWHRLMGLSSWLSTSAWRHGVPPERQGHPPAQPFQAVRCFDQPRRDEKPPVFEPPQAPCPVRLACVGGADLGVTQLAGVARGAQDLAGLGGLVLRKRVVICTDGRLDVPRGGHEGRVRRGTAFARVACVFGERRGLEAVLRPALGPCAAGLLSGCGSAHAWGLQRQEVRGDGRGFALGGFLQRGFGTRQSGL